MCPITLKLEKGKFTNSLPVWFDPNKEYSLAQWLLLYFERALWIQFEANVRQATVM
jgi:hypothetical protein